MNEQWQVSIIAWTCMELIEYLVSQAGWKEVILTK